MVSRVRAGKAFMTLQSDEEPIAPAALLPGRDHVAALSSKGRLLVFGLDELREVPRGRGVIVMGLDPGERLAAIGLFGAKRVLVAGTNRSGRQIVHAVERDELARHRSRRARKGALLSKRIKPTGFAASE
jgi:topoisomerase-4 subunit A